MSPTTDNIITLLEEHIGIGRINPDDSVYEYGFNSIMFIEFVSHLESTFKVSLDLNDFTEIDEATTVKKLATMFSTGIEQLYVQ